MELVTFGTWELWTYLSDGHSQWDNHAASFGCFCRRRERFMHEVATYDTRNS